jgi:hypothetical protein
MYSKIIKKQKFDKLLAPDAKELKVGKKASEHAMKYMAPEIEEDEDEDEMEEGSLSKKDKSKFKGMMPESRIEIELILAGAKKKLGK